MVLLSCRYPRGWCLWNIIHQDAMRIMCCEANVIIYNSVMKRWSWQMSLHLLTGLPQAQLLPDILSYTSPLSALVTNRSTWHRAMNLFWDTTRSSVEPDLLSFNLLLGALRDVDAAMSGWQLCLSLVSGILLLPGWHLVAFTHVTALLIFMGTYIDRTAVSVYTCACTKSTTSATPHLQSHGECFCMVLEHSEY